MGPHKHGNAAHYPGHSPEGSCFALPEPSFAYGELHSCCWLRMSCSGSGQVSATLGTTSSGSGLFRSLPLLCSSESIQTDCQRLGDSVPSRALLGTEQLGTLPTAAQHSLSRAI